MEYLLLALILYFILRAGGNLVRLLRGDGMSPSQGEPTRKSSSREKRWEGPSPRQQTGTAWERPTFWNEDVEDATWYDLDDGPRRRGEPSR